MIRTLADLELLRESVDVEAKAAQGRDGQGEVPGAFWESYSALANTDGGYIVLGVREQGDGSLEVLGLANLEKVRTELWNGLNNPQKVSANLLGEGAIESLQEMFGAGRGSHYRLGTEATELGSEGSESSTEPSELPAGLRESLEQAFADLRGSRKAPKERVRQAILEACRHGFIPLRELARLLGRKPDTLRLLYLPELLASGELEARYPEHPKHPNQAYRTREGA